MQLNFTQYVIVLPYHLGLILSNGHSPQIRQNGELLVQMCRGESHFSQKSPLANVGKSGESGQSSLANVDECIESGQSRLANVDECIESDQNRLANGGESVEYSPILLANVGASAHDRIGRF
jgi:hypothetical protein